MILPVYSDKSNPAATVHAVQITEVTADPAPKDSGRAKLKFIGGRESVCNGNWTVANAPKAGGYFVMFDNGGSAIFMEAQDFIRRFSPAEEG